MNAIVVVFVPAGDGQLLAQQTAVGSNLDILRQGRDLDDAKTDPVWTSNRTQTTPPFWTWFIENPRSCGP